MRFVIAIATGSLCLGVLCGCPKPNEERWAPPNVEKDYGRPLPPGMLALRKIPPEMYPDFSRGFGHYDRLEESIRNSLSYLAKKSSQKYFPYGDVSHARAVASLEAFLTLMREAQSPQDLDRLIRERFDVYQSIGWNDKGEVLFTGYYCPIFDGRKQRDSVFRYPLYKLPPDLVKDAEGTTLGRRKPDGGMVPYWTRQEVDQAKPLEGTEIAWLKNPFEAYVVGVQGSAKLRLADGRLWELGYAGNNGHDYVPIAKAMIEDGKLDRNKLSLQTLIRYFEQNPGDLEKYAWKNPRYVFFQETRGGPYGSINVPVIPYRSIATDKQVFPRACLSFLDTKLPVPLENGDTRPAPFAEFACDQDTGGAIRAAGRCDVYMGVGPAAEQLAGRTYAEGKLYYVFLKSAGG